MAGRPLSRALRSGFAVLAAVGVLASCANDKPRASPSTTIVSSPDAPAEASAPDGWALPGHDYDNSRATFTSSINSTNVAGLHEAWSVDVDGALSTVPLIVDDVVYVQDGSGTVRAIDLESGAPRWKSKPYGFNIGPFGVAVADGRVFAMYGSKGVVALDADTGDELWTREITATPTDGVDIQPVAFGGMVYASTVPVSIGGIYTGGDRGVLHALDAATGEVRWTFDTVDSADVWGNPAVNSGGGAWYPPSIDAERGIMYWGTANPAPFPGTAEFPNGTSRPGPNLYTDSTVALDAATGKLEWYHQIFPHDIFDRDMIHTLIARPKKGTVVVGTGKGGVLVGLDPDTGKALWRTEVGLHENDDLAALPGPTEVAPGTYGGVLTPPATAEGVVYVAVVNAPVTLKPDEVSYFGAEFGQAKGEVDAVDAATGKVLWSSEVPGDPLGAATVVNDLVLTVLIDGTVVALDRATGEQVWTTKLAGGTNGWLTASGNKLVIPVGSANPPRLVAYQLG